MADLKHFVVTTRQVSALERSDYSHGYKAENNYSTQGAKYMRFGHYLHHKATKADKTIDVTDAIFYNHNYKHNEDNDFSYCMDATSVFPEEVTKPGSGSEAMFNAIFNELEKTGKALLVFMYGFSNMTKKELSHVELIDKAYLKSNSAVGSLLVISWPSQAFVDWENLNDAIIPAKKWKLIKYEYLEELHTDVKTTGYSLALLLLKLASFVETRKAKRLFVPKIHFMPQSMGNRIVNCMMEKLAVQPEQLSNRVNKLFDKLILMSPDMHEDGLDPANGWPYRNVHLLANQTFLISSKNDPVLPRVAKIHDCKILGITGASKKPDFIRSIEFHQYGNVIFYKSLQTQRHRFFEFHEDAIHHFNMILAGHVTNYPDKTILHIDWPDSDGKIKLKNYDYINNRPADA
jgi:DNA-binding Lrp family transcriptional regulator